MYEIDLKQMVEDNFKIYAGMVIQKRALVDVRDCLKPSARQLMYAQYIDKITWKGKYQKSLKSVGAGTSHFYVHGDGSAYGTLIRMGKPFVMRYRLEDVSGNYGTMTKNGNEAASRYTEMRLDKLSSYLFADIEKNTINSWFDNYDNTEKFPSVLPSLGFYNIVNGTMGIGVALASSIPQFNITDVNTALIKLLDNPDIDFDDIYCIPDFATGGILINAAEVKESLRTGHGKACKLRAKIEYDEKEHCLIVSEMPFGVFTDTVCGQLGQLLEDKPTCGIDKFIDLTKKTPNIKIMLTKKANINKVIKTLYAKTDLQSYCSINMTMLDNGTSPRIFGWKEALSAHLTHEKEVLKNSLEYDLNKYKARLHIVEGLLIALANIEDIIATIKASSNGATAKIALMEKFNLDELQAKAILDIKLVRLANLEAVEVQNEKNDLLEKIENLNSLIASQPKMNEILKAKLIEVMKKYGDPRRTEVQNISFDDEEEEPVEIKELIVYLTNFGNLYTEEKTSLMVQRRGGAGKKIKMAKNEYIIDTIVDINSSTCLGFSNKGKAYSFNMSNLPVNSKINLGEMFDFESGEVVTKLLPFNKMDKYSSIIFSTKQGMVKKSALSEYRIKKSKGVVAIKLKENDEIVGIDFVNNEPLEFLTLNGNCIIIDTEEIKETSRATMGVCGIKLRDGDSVIQAKIIPANTNSILFVSQKGIGKKVSYAELGISNRATKGSSIQKLKDGDLMADFLPLSTEDNEAMFISTIGSIKISTSTMSELSRAAQGVQMKKVVGLEKIIKLEK